MDGNMVFFAFRKEYEFDLFDLNRHDMWFLALLYKRGAEALTMQVAALIVLAANVDILK